MKNFSNRKRLKIESETFVDVYGDKVIELLGGISQIEEYGVRLISRSSGPQYWIVNIELDQKESNKIKRVEVIHASNGKYSVVTWGENNSLIEKKENLKNKELKAWVEAMINSDRRVQG